MRERRLVIAALLAAAAISTPAAVAEQPHVKTISFTASYNDPGTRITGLGGVNAGCAPGYASIGGTAYFDAPLHSVDTYVGCLSFDPTQQIASHDTSSVHATGETWDTQNGSLTGCGKGSFVMHQTYIRFSFNSATNTGHVSLKWTLEKGAGAFLGATGHGTGDGDFTGPTAAGLPGLPNAGSYTGTITCPHHD